MHGTIPIHTQTYTNAYQSKPTKNQLQNSDHRFFLYSHQHPQTHSDFHFHSFRFVLLFIICHYTFVFSFYSFGGCLVPSKWIYFYVLKCSRGKRHFLMNWLSIAEMWKFTYYLLITYCTYQIWCSLTAQNLLSLRSADLLWCPPRETNPLHPEGPYEILRLKFTCNQFLYNMQNISIFLYNPWS